MRRELDNERVGTGIGTKGHLRRCLRNVQIVGTCGLLNSHFIQLHSTFTRLHHTYVQLRTLLKPFILLTVALIHTKLALVMLYKACLLLNNRLSVLAFIVFLIINSHMFSPLASTLAGFARFHRFSVSKKHVLSLVGRPRVGKAGRTPRSNGVVFRGISFNCRRGRILRKVSIVLSQGSLATLINPSKDKGDAMVGLYTHFCSPAGKHVLFNKMPMQRVRPRGLVDHVSVIFRSICLFRSDVHGGVQFNGDSTASRRVMTTTGGTYYRSFVVRLPRNCSAVIKRKNYALSNNRGRQLSVTHTVLGSTRVILLSRTATSLSPRGRMRVRGTVSALVGKQAIVIVTRHLGAVVKTSRVIILSSKGIRRRNARSRLVYQSNLCQGL